MLKKVALCASLLVSVFATAEINLDFVFNRSNNGIITSVISKKIILDENGCGTVREYETTLDESLSLIFTLKAKEITEEGITIKCTIKEPIDHKHHMTYLIPKIIAKPVIRAEWDKQAFVVLNNSLGELTFAITASRQHNELQEQN